MGGIRCIYIVYMYIHKHTERERGGGEREGPSVYTCTCIYTCMCVVWREIPSVCILYTRVCAMFG